MVEDPLNDRHASHPFGANSVCEAAGYAEPRWVVSDPDVPAGRLVEFELESAALGRTTTTSVYLPAGFTTDGEGRYPLLVVHDGSDYLAYASAATVLDNLIHRGDIPPAVVALVRPFERLVEYADDPRHAEHLTAELVPALENDLPLVADAVRAVPHRGELRRRGVVVGRVASAGVLRSAAAPVGLVRRRRHGLPPSARAALAAGPPVRARLPRPTGRRRRAGLRHVRCLRVADLREPRPRSGARTDGDGRAVRRDPRWPQLGLLARQPRRRPALAARRTTGPEGWSSFAPWPTSPAGSGSRWAPTCAGRSATRRSCAASTWRSTSAGTRCASRSTG